jgi:hypothetical protein
MKYLLVSIFVFVSISMHAQFRGNNWVFGDSIIVHFDGNASPLIGQLNSEPSEANAAISDSSGQLLFYSGGRFNTNIFSTYVYNSLGSLMGNSANIAGDASATQGTIILPVPDSPDLFYVFVIARNPSTLVTQLFYNVVDRSLNGGLGSVIQKNGLLCDSMLCEMMNAVKHANGRDWWLIVHQRYSANFLLYLISPMGISGPYIQSMGLTINNTIAGESAFSNDGEKFAQAICDGNLQLLDFDRCSGILSNCLELGDSISNLFGYYGCEFSSSRSKLYASYSKDSLFQFDLSSTNIKSSRTPIYSFSNQDYGFTQQQLAENGKIYLASTNWSNWQNIDSITTSLSVINDPDSAGLQCSFQPYTFIMDGRLTVGLPNNPNYALGPVAGSVCDSLTAAVDEKQSKNNFTIYPNPADAFFTIRSEGVQKAKITVTDARGNRVMQEWMLNDRKTFIIGELPPGIYIVNIQTDATQEALKLVRMNKGE